MIPPKKPFNAYKWRWATLTPTEGLNEPPIYLGVLRVLRAYEGFAPSSVEVAAALSVVEQQISGKVATRVRLQRSQERNLLRHSGQYWKALGLLSDTSGMISLTDYGRRVADGGITKDEFAITVIKSLTLPNRLIEDTSEWQRVGLEIKPLELILKILAELARSYGITQAFITPIELSKVVIPLAGTNAPLEEYVESIILYREDSLDMTEWSNCTPEANDERMAREFLLFLSHYGFCNRVGTRPQNEKYCFDESALSEIQNLTNLRVNEGETVDIITQIRATNSSVIARRQRVQRAVWERPGQYRFRQDVLKSYDYSCLLTQEKLPDVLEAAHIIPVKYNGSDALSNGLCLRADLHRLFDGGHLRIAPNGGVVLSEAAQQSPTYSQLPQQIMLPSFLSRDSIKWRWNYY